MNNTTKEKPTSWNLLKGLIANHKKAAKKNIQVDGVKYMGFSEKKPKKSTR